MEKRLAGDVDAEESEDEESESEDESDRGEDMSEQGRKNLVMSFAKAGVE